MTKKVLLISSCGGHWVQMNRLTPAFANCDIHFASTERDYANSVPNSKFSYIPDASLSSGKLRILYQAFCVLLLVIRLRPKVVLTTGAAPGFFGVFFGRLLGAKTIWVDSIANVEKLSVSGEKARKYAHLHVTQWEHLAVAGETQYFGSVI